MSELVHVSGTLVAVCTAGVTMYRSYCPGCLLAGLTLFPTFWGPCADCHLGGLIASAPSRGHWLYRLWSSDGRLLYVGITLNPKARLRAHWKRWSLLIDRATWEECNDEYDMLAREAHSINTEHPAFNVVHPEAR